MMKNQLKSLAALLPKRWQQGLKRRYFAWLIRRQRFGISEPEYAVLGDLMAAGDWALDVGANIGSYTLKLAQLAGENGRVVAFEPVRETFELLAANVALLRTHNVTLINAAASDEAAVLGMAIPKFDTGLDNPYMAHLSETSASLRVLCVRIDALELPHPIRLVKIDAEGHELSVLKGMSGILRRDKPTLIVEDNSDDVAVYLRDFGYSSTKMAGSSNRVFR